MVIESEKSNVVGLREPDQLRTNFAQMKPDATLIAHLEEMLEGARSGRLQGIVYVAMSHRQVIDYNTVGIMTSYLMLGGLEHLKYYILQQIEGVVPEPPPDGAA